MEWLDKLERKFGNLAVPNLTLYIIAGQVITYLGAGANLNLLSIALIPEKVIQGEVYRLFTFVFWPPGGSLILCLFGWYIFWMYGRGLEEHWGIFKFNLYILIGIIATIVAAFFFPAMPSTNIYLFGAVILAFASVYPDFELLMFFILPVKVKYLAWLTCAWFVLDILRYGPYAAALVGAAVLSFLIFFGPEFLRSSKAKKRSTSYLNEMQKNREDFEKEIEEWNRKHHGEE